MKIKFLLTLFSLYFFIPSWCQPETAVLDKVTVKDLKLNECPFEKDASAFYLLNSAKVNFSIYSDLSSKLTTQRKIRIKILNKKGFEYANVMIPHLGNKKTSKITDIEAYIYTLDSAGNIVKTKVDKKDIFKSQVTRKNNLNTVKFTFPGLQPGCIIEYSYEHIESGKYDIEPWIFQNEIPIAISYCEVSYPNFANLDFRMAGISPEEDDYKELTVDSTKSTYTKSFVMKNIPPFKIEPMMTSLVDNLKRVEFSLNPEPGFNGPHSITIERKWNLIISRLNRSFTFGKQQDTPIPGTEALIDSLKQLKSSKDKISAVYGYVNKHMEWDKHQSMYPGDINEAWKTKSGNSAEINMIILNLLRKTGINCCPVLISTRENGKTDTRFPHLSQFNGLDVLAIDNADYYVLDGSIQGQSYSIPPLNVINRNVFAVLPETYKWFNITETRPLIRDSVFVDAELNKDGYIKGKAVNVSFNLSRVVRLTEKDESNNDAKDLLNDVPDFTVDTSWAIDRDVDTMPLKEFNKFHFTLPHNENSYFLKPYLFNSLQKNPFPDSMRSTEVDFGCNQQYIQTTRISLPPEMLVENLPKSILIRTADTSILYSRKISQKANVIIIETNFSINKNLYAPDEYPVLWQFFKKVYGLLTEGIVLDKKH